MLERGRDALTTQCVEHYDSMRSAQLSYQDAQGLVQQLRQQKAVVSKACVTRLLS
jgi:hypothetical protein